MTVEHPPQLSAAQAELLARRLRGGSDGGAGEEAALTRQDRGERPTLSFAQQRLWFLEQMHPGSIAYITADTVYRVRGPLDVPALERALRSVAERHTTLRSHFADDAGQPYVVVCEADRTVLRTVDLAGRADPHAAVAEYLAEELQTPFDLAAGPLLRTTLLRLAEDDHVLAAVVHHIAFDGWSIGVFERDLATAYRAALAGGEPGWAPLPVDYTDYAAWQHAAVTGRRTEQLLEHWRRTLQGAPTTLQLPTDRPRPAVPGYQGAVVSFRVDAEAADGLRALSRAQGATPFMTTLAVFQALLSRHTNSTDFLVGCPASGRIRPEVEDLVGFFVNTLPVRADLAGDPTVREVVDRVRSVTLDAFAHQDLPFQRLIEELAPPRETSLNPLVQVWFDVSGPAVGLELDGAEVETVPHRRPSTNFDLTLHLTEAGSGPLTGELVYATDLFDEATARSLAEQYVHLLEQAARHPDDSLADLPAADTGVLAERLDAWNDTARPVPDGTVTDAFERQVGRTPEAIALVEGDRRLTYRELNTRSNRLAHALRERGVGPERTVGLLLPRGTDFVVALLAVLKAGGGYLPLDPAYPEDRLAYILGDAGADLVVTDSRLAGLLPKDTPAVLLQADGLGAHPSADPEPLATGDNLCYVIYTSGSTGRPKGVAMAHAPLLNLIQWQVDRTTVTGPTLQFSSLHFDASFQELFTTFLTGGSLVLIGEEERRDPRRVLAAIRTHDVRRLFCPPMVLEQLAVQDAAEATAPLPLREIVTAGERLALGKEVRSFLARMPGIALENQCGPTETHAVVAHLMTGPPQEWPTRPPIGRPIANTRIHVLDARMRAVPVGMPGELYVTRPWLARGYVGRPDLTAERFLPSPYATEPGQLMYRTGDLVRWRAEGTVEFLGRADDQVKIRGYRVEPAEVEARLRDIPEVAEAAVLPVEVAPGDRRLVAYLTPEGGSVPGAAQLRALLAQSLPDYLIPSHFVPVFRLPLTATGKLDRHALLRVELPEPDTGPEAGSRPPRGPREEILAGLFAEVLALPTVGAEDDFFALGGHSLLATRLIARIRTAFGVELPIRDLFRTPTVAGLVDLLEASRPSRPALVPAPRPPVLPLSAAQRRIWFLSRARQSTDYNSPFALRLRGRLDQEGLEAALAEVVTRHEALRTVFPDDGGDPCQRILPADSVPRLLERVECPPDGLDRILSDVAGREFDLASEPPLRAVLVRTASFEHVLILVVHHVATDGWSLGVLLRDLFAAYDAHVTGVAHGLPPLPVQYADFTQWQLALLAEEADPASAAGRQLAFWRERLAGLPTELELPYDRPRPGTADNSGGTVPLVLDAALHGRLLRLARAHGCTLLMVLQAALAALLSRLGAGTDIPIGVPAAGRGDEALDDLVGVFVNTLVLRTDVSGDPTFVELLARVREWDLAAYEHADLPFERVVEAVNPDRSLARHPLFQVVLQLDRSVTDGLAPAGLEASEEPVPFEVSKFDLRVALADGGGTAGEPTGLHGVLEYAEALFDQATAEELAARLHRLLVGLAADPDRRIGSVELLTAEERRRILVDWNDTAADVPTRTVPELFERCARETPDAPAVRDGECVLSYGELNARANRFARHLAGLGIGPGRLVAVALPRTPELVAVLLGVLKAGAGYLPLDPGQPPERLGRIIGSAAPALTVTTTALADSLPVTARLLLDEPDASAAVGRHAGGDLGPSERTAEPTPADTAYVIYTSGSTGEPKGVVIEHRSLSLYLAWARHAYPAMAGRALVHSPVAFDLTVTGLWGPLTCGGSLELVTLDDAEPGTVEQPTFVKATPSHLGLFRILPESYAPTGQLVLGGELLLGAALDEWRALHPGVTVVNEYGPTETTVGCAEYRIEPGEAVPAGGVTIGRPIWNTQWYVLDEALSPVPAGVVGELFIGGGLLARGYLNQPDLTAARFLPDPYGAPGARMYRTGDLVRWRHDGQAEFVGRVDDQVKVRGFRVELGEVEAVLSTLPGVAAAAVTVVGGDRLVAHLVPDGPEGLDSEAVRAAAAGLLPSYMQPSVYAPIDRLPLTKNGKLDRGRLPVPEVRSAGAGRAPDTALEKSLCALFAEVLDLPHVDVDDGFFTLGGQSLRAARLVALIRRTLGLRAGIQDLFAAPSVAALAARLEAGGRQDSVTPLLTLRTGRSRDRAPLFCVHPGAGIGWVYTGLLDPIDPDQPVHALQAPTLRPQAAPPASVAELACDYVRQVREIQPSGPYRLLGWSFGALVAHAMAVRLQEEGEDVDLLALLDGYPPEADAAPSAADGVPDPLAELLRSLGRPSDGLSDGRLTVADFVRLTGREDGPLAGLDEETIAAMARTFTHHSALGRAHRPGVFKGDALFFQAAADPDSGDPQAWRRFVTGELEVHRVDCVHGAMMHRRPAERIGAAIAAVLRRPRV